MIAAAAPPALPRRQKIVRARGGAFGPMRGVALIIVLTTLAILTSIGVEFSYSTRVNLKLAENMRDEMRAFYLARSAISMARLLLHFQKQLDTTGGQMGKAIQNVLGPKTSGSTTSTPAGLGALAGANTGGIGIRLWELVPIDSNAFGMVLSGSGLAEGVDPSALGADRDPADLAARQKQLAEEDKRPPGAPPIEGGPLHAFGEFSGAYSAKIVDENSRINVRGLDGLSGQPAAVLTQLRAMMADPKYDFIFDEDDANRDRVRRDDVILALKDWIDADETGSGIDPTNTRAPFVNAFSDENAAYDRYTPRYKAKNAPADSLQELYMVRGVNDRFMAAFGDRLTVWLDVNSGLNINSNDPQQMVTNILIVAANPLDPRLRDPLLIRTILQDIQVRKMFSFFGLSKADFVSIVKANGVTPRPEFDNPNSPNNFLDDKSDTFRITATGRVGSVEKKITAVVRYDDLLGKLLYWKEE
jgi:general secretion pathway protein K